MEAELDPADYARARDDIRSQSTEGAEKILDTLAQQKTGNSAAAIFYSGRLAEFRMDFNRAMLRLDKAVELDSKNLEYLQAAGLLARKLYQHKKALIRFIAMEKLLVAKGEDSVELALARRELAYSAALFGKHKQAGSYYKKAMASLAKLLGKNDREMGICWLQIGKLQETLGQYEKAEAPYKQALAIMDKTDDDIVLADVLDKLARLLMELEGEPDAIPLFKRLCAIKEKSPHPDQAGLIIIYNNIAEANRICGKYDKSEENYKQALTITQELRGKDHPAVASIYQELAKLCNRQSKSEEAKKYQEMSAAIFQRVLEEQEAAGDKDERLTL
jgi:tetratricopeptide (TPR) repeat protein